jgi:hypothetical protein
MATSVTTIRERVLAHQFSSARYGTYINTFIDEAQKAIARRIRAEVLETVVTITTAANDAYYDFFDTGSGVVVQPIFIYDDEENHILDYLTLNEFDQLETASGRPTHYTFDINQIRFYPTPDKAYTITGRINALTTTIDINANIQLDDEYVQAIVDYCLWRAYTMEHDASFADRHKAEFDEGVLRLTGEEVMKTRDNRPRQVPGMIGYYSS